MNKLHNSGGTDAVSATAGAAMLTDAAPATVLDACTRYVADPVYRAEIDAQVAARRAEINAMFPSGWTANQARWAREEGA